MRREPGRTCLGCREVREKRALVRLVRRASGEVVADPAGRLPGRGAYVCPDGACLERGLERKRLAHAFRKPCELSEEVRGLWQRQR
ncbi:MAG: YlxR family protein [Candidatus Rokubacteria bacterium]|nr:YlxR family protein [Candidatus Rokubacteria bacterium]MBI2491695.1 YlxR family protein [Candidatus Rokubacteria bacterium]